MLALTWHPWPSPQKPHGHHHSHSWHTGGRDGDGAATRTQTDPAPDPPSPPPATSPVPHDVPVPPRCQCCACRGGQSVAADGEGRSQLLHVPRLVPAARGRGSSPLAWPMEPALHPGFQRGQEGAPHVTAPMCPRAVLGPHGGATHPSQRCSPAPGARPWLSAGAISWRSLGEGGAGGEGGTDPGSSRYCRAWPAARGPRRLSLRAAGPRTAASWSWPLARRSPSTGSMGTTPPTRRELQHSTAPLPHAPSPAGLQPPPGTEGSWPLQTTHAPGPGHHGRAGHSPWLPSMSCRHCLPHHHAQAQTPRAPSRQRCHCHSLPCSSLPFGVPAPAVHVPPHPRTARLAPTHVDTPGTVAPRTCCTHGSSAHPGREQEPARHTSILKDAPP